MRKMNLNEASATNELILGFVIDEQKLLTSQSGLVSGVYGISCINKLGQEFYLYIGESEEVQGRLWQHLHRFFDNGYLEYWSGLTLADLASWKLKVQLLFAEEEHERRMRQEEHFLSETKPILQDTKGKFALYPSKNYSRPDLCIHPWALRDKDGRVLDPRGQRRIAFLEKVAELKASM